MCLRRFSDCLAVTVASLRLHRSFVYGDLLATALRCDGDFTVVSSTVFWLHGGSVHGVLVATALRLDGDFITVPWCDES